MKHLQTLVLAAALCSGPASAFTLIKSEEAMLPPAAGVLTTRGISRGPGVRLPAAAQTTGITSPFSLKVGFEPRGGIKIDPAATTVTYLKANPVDLLPRVKSGLSEQGLTLEGAEAPPGEHAIQISVRDSEGRVTHAVLQLHIVK